MSSRHLPVLGSTSIHLGASTPDFHIALVHPYLPASQFKNRLKNRESLSLAYLAAALRQHGFQCRPLNAEMLDLGPDEVCRDLLSDPQMRLLGLSLKSQRTYRAAKKIAAEVRRQRPDVHIVVGGVFPSAANAQVLEDCADFDSLVRGEGETAIVEIAARLERGLPLSDMLGLTHRRGSDIVINPPRPRITDLDQLAFPARDDLEYLLQHRSDTGISAYIVGSRGCYARCTFCSIHALYDGSHLRVQRSADSVVAELEALEANYGIRRFQFVDDLFVMPSQRGREWVRRLRELIEDRRLRVELYGEMRSDTVTDDVLCDLRAAGLDLIFVGMDAGSDTVLDRMDKGTTVAQNDEALEVIRRQGIDPDNVVLGYIMFEPEMSLAELKANYDWIRQSGYCNVQHLQNRMNVYHGTPQYERMHRKGTYDVSAFGERWNYTWTDGRVAAFEAAFRRFQDRFMSECHEDLVRAKVAWRLRAQKGVPISERDTLVSGDKLTSWLGDLFNQAYRRVEGLERAAYYFVFDNLFVWLEHRECHPEWREEKIWQGLVPLIEQLQLESRQLVAFAERADTLRLVDEVGGEPPIDAAWTSDGVAWVWLQLAGGHVGYRAVIGARGRDRLDHCCELVRFVVDGAGAWRAEPQPAFSSADLVLLPEPMIEPQCC